MSNIEKKIIGGCESGEKSREEIDGISFEDFAFIVQQMRHTQRRYSLFQDKPGLKEKCRIEEKEVDKMLAKIFDKQLTMFR